MTKCTGVIKEKLSLEFLVDKLMEKRIINEKQKKEVTDEHTKSTAEQRIDKLLDLLKASIKDDGDDFRLFLNIIKEQDTRITDRLYKTLFDTYKNLAN